jgi:sensor c-di-GMP phosphodiesterase-like protein
VAVEDFGTGFSAPSGLQCLAIDVKIEESFICPCLAACRP